MLYLIYGENALGKTRYLLDVARKSTSFVTNLPTLMDTFSVYDENKLRLLEEFLACDVRVASSGLVFDNPVFDIREDVMWLVRKMCTKGEVLLLDEPESRLSVEYQDEVYNIIAGLYKGFEDVYVATHAGNLALFSGASVMTIAKGKMVPLSRRAAYEMSL